MRPRIVAAIVRKDLKAFTRDRFFFFITILGLVTYAVMYFVMPSDVDETVTFGISHTGLDGQVAGIGAASGFTGLDLVEYPDPDALRTAVTDGSDGVIAGISFPPDFHRTVEAGEQARVELLIPADVPAEHRVLLKGLAGVMADLVVGYPLPVDPITDVEVLGTDRVGDQISLQDQMRPMLLFLVLMVETFALASLVAIELQERTVTAVLATPATVGDVVMAKGMLGTGLAFVEVSLLGVIVGAYGTNLPLMAVALLLGSVLVTGFGLIAGSFGRDFIEILIIAFGLMIPLLIPAFAALFPGTAPAWVRWIPSYGLIDSITAVSARGETWSDVAGTLGVLAVWAVATLAAGTLILRRRVATL